jgi:fucose 4-O-acetylase-like acetyltransferase
MSFKDKLKIFLQMDKILASGRDHQIDALKGVAIILVVLGHSVQINDPNFDNNLIFRIIYSFHMPMFMFLSGFIILGQSGYTFPVYVKKNAIRLLTPFLIWYFVSYIIVRFHQDVSLAVYFFDLAKSPGRGLWFLWILFLNSTLLFGALKLARCKKQQHRENYFVIAAILISLTASADFLALADVKQYFPYYAAGFFVCKYRNAIKARREIIYLLAVVVFPILVFSWKRNALPTFYPDLLNFLNNEDIAQLVVSVYKYALAFGGIALCSFILERIRQSWLYSFFGWLGTLTLDIYACHSYFLFEFSNTAWWYFSAAVVSLFFSLALSFLLLRRFKITKLLFLGQVS